MNFKKGLTSAIAVAATVCASAAFAKDKVTVAYFLEWPTANQVAQVDKAYDEAMGVEVEWRAFGNGNEMSQAMASGDIDISFSQGLVPFVVAVSSGLQIETVGVAVSYAEADNCVIRADSGITQENAAELEGKKIATPIGNVTHYKLLRILDHLGVDANKVEMVQMNGADAAVAVARGDVVMGCAFGGPLQRMGEHGAPLMTAAEQEEIGIRVFDVISVSSQFKADHPDLLKKFMEVTDAANAAYYADPDGKLSTIASAAGMDEDATKNMLGMFAFPSSADQASEAWLGGAVPAFMKEVADFFVEQGQMESAAGDYSSVVDASFVQ